MNRIDLTTSVVGTTLLATVGGELDLGNASALQAKLADELREAEATDVDLDLARVAFIDSSGLAALAGLAQAARDRGGRVRLVDASPLVRRIVGIAGLDYLFA